MEEYEVSVRMEHSGRNIKKRLQLYSVAPDVKIAALILPGDVLFTVECAHSLAQMLKKQELEFDVLLTAEFKGVVLAAELARILGHERFAVARKCSKIYMGECVSTQMKTITTGKEERVYLSQQDAAYLKSKRVLVVDDVISTGGSLGALQRLCEKCGGEYAGAACVALEARNDSDILHLAQIPLFDGKGNIK